MYILNVSYKKKILKYLRNKIQSKFKPSQEYFLQSENSHKRIFILHHYLIKFLTRKNNCYYYILIYPNFNFIYIFKY